MSRRLVPGLLLLTLLLAAGGASPAALGTGVSGAFLKAEGRKPISGALVVLYEEGTGHLVDSTYTRDDGKFNLVGPRRKGRYLLVATRGEVAERTTLTYDPGAPGVYREILHATEKSFWARAGAALLALIKGFFGTMSGFLLGYLFKQWEARRGAAKALDQRTTELRGLLMQAGLQFRAAIEGLRDPIPDSRYRKVLADLLSRLDAVEAELVKGSIQDAAFELRGARGTDEYLNLRSRVGRIREIAGSREEVGFGAAGERLRQLEKLLQGLETHSLLCERPSWWRRTGSTS